MARTTGTSKKAGGKKKTSPRGQSASVPYQFGSTNPQTFSDAVAQGYVPTAAPKKRRGRQPGAIYKLGATNVPGMPSDYGSVALVPAAKKARKKRRQQTGFAQLGHMPTQFVKRRKKWSKEKKFAIDFAISAAVSIVVKEVMDSFKVRPLYQAVVFGAITVGFIAWGKYSIAGGVGSVAIYESSFELVTWLRARYPQGFGMAPKQAESPTRAAGAPSPAVP